MERWVVSDVYGVLEEAERFRGVNNHLYGYCHMLLWAD